MGLRAQGALKRRGAEGKGGHLKASKQTILSAMSISRTTGQIPWLSHLADVFPAASSVSSGTLSAHCSPAYQTKPSLATYEEARAIACYPKRPSNCNAATGTRTQPANASRTVRVLVENRTSDRGTVASGYSVKQVPAASTPSFLLEAC